MSDVSRDTRVVAKTMNVFRGHRFGAIPPFLEQALDSQVFRTRVAVSTSKAPARC
jgi:hypothetical protein